MHFFMNKKKLINERKQNKNAKNEIKLVTNFPKSILRIQNMYIYIQKQQLKPKLGCININK